MAEASADRGLVTFVAARERRSMMFFFDTDDGEARIPDRSGIDLAGDREALEQAVAFLRDLSHVPAMPGTRRDIAVTVRGPDGSALYAASLRLTVDRIG